MTLVKPEKRTVVTNQDSEQVITDRRMRRRRTSVGARAATLIAALAVSAAAPGQVPGVSLYAAGGLRAPMDEVVAAFAAAGGPPVKVTYGPSGQLRERIEKGESAEVFASADMENVQALVWAGRAAAPVVFARNRLCALVAQEVAASPETLLDRMLDPKVKLGTSTPKADPSGDYAWQLFDKAERVHPGAQKALDAKALKLTGGPDSPPASADRSIYGVLIATHKADIFLTYCANATQAAREVPGAQVVAVPDGLAVGADYTLTTMKGASPFALLFATYILSPKAQEILARHGLTPGATK
jgi:molybdate transport system substrate-binding protein